MKNTLTTMLQGLIIGIANIIPGVSGGTMAFALGIYDKLTEAAGYFLLRPEKRKEYFLFLMQIGIGVIVGLLLFAKIIAFLLGTKLQEGAELPITYIPTITLFLGLILGSIPILFNMQKDIQFSIKRLGIAILGMITLIIISNIQSLNPIGIEAPTLIKDYGIFKIVLLSTSRMIWLFILGIIIAFTMVVPGVSGSALLIALGEYGEILTYIDERSLVPIFIFMIGVGGGIVLSSLLISKLFEKYPGATFYFILGLVAISCVQVLLQIIFLKASLIIWSVSILTLVCGIYMALLCSKLQIKKIDNTI